MKKDFLTFSEISAAEADSLFRQAARFKQQLAAGIVEPVLAGKSAVMIFEKPSTRTRVSFEIGIAQLGATPVVLDAGDMQIGRGETIEDTGRVLSRYADAVIIRTFAHNEVERLAAAASVPVINALSDTYHPCQALSDLFTIWEKKGSLRGVKLGYLGDGNNVCHSLMLAAAVTGMNMTAACPPGFGPLEKVMDEVAGIAGASGSDIIVTSDPETAAAGADALYTDVWVSMGDEAEAERRREAFRPYQLNEGVLSHAKPDAMVMHCLPAHRGEEISADLIDGPHSIVFDQAENRLHVQKALLVTLLL